MTHAPLSLIFMGTPTFALPALQALIAAGHEIVAVYSQPSRPAGRGQKEMPSPVHAYALSQQLAVYTPVTLKDEHVQEIFRAHGADAAIIAAYGLLLPKPILEATPLGCINIHPSLLPRWRGAAPIQRTIMAGDTESGVVIMQMDAGLDTGDMLAVNSLPIRDGTTSGELHDALAAMSATLLVETLDRLRGGEIQSTRQPDDGVTYAHKITREDCHIDWCEHAFAIRQKILALNPQPGAFFAYQDETLKVWQAEWVAHSSRNVAPGTVLDEQLTIACGKDALRLKMLQRPGKKAMPAQELLRGFALPPGTLLA